MKNLILTCTLIFVAALLYANSNIRGQVFDADGTPLAYANTILHNAADSAVLKLELTNEDGSFQFSNLPPNAYFIKISYVGMPEFTTEIFTPDSDPFTLPDIHMDAPGTALETVTVTAERPLLELKADKMVFNVEGSINANGDDALTLLRKSPGLVVDNNDQIQMMGKSGVRVYIDGKPSPLNGDELAAYLKTIQASEIDNIEIITNPSARYEAEGSAGIVNIRMKKDKRHGANANISAGYSIGEKAKYNGGISGNYRNKKVNLFARYNYYNGENTNHANIRREIEGYDVDNRSDMNSQWESHYASFGSDFYINKKNTIGFLVKTGKNKSSWNNNSRTYLSLVGQETPDSILVAKPESENTRDNYNFNLNYIFDNGNSVTWNIDADYGMFRNTGTEFQPNVYWDGGEKNILREAYYETNTPVNIDIASFKIDHERPLLEGQLGIGVKYGNVKTDNTFDFYNIDRNDENTEQDDEKILDINRSNNFVYTENVNAAYVTYSRKFGKFNVNAGLRTEHTRSDGKLTSMIPAQNDQVKRSYVDFFPSGGLSWQMNDKNSLQLNYSSRINRPNYQDMNPFKTQLDELTVEQGNPFLNPEYVDNIQLSHSWNYTINTSFKYSYTRDMISQIIDTTSILISGVDTSSAKGSYISWLNVDNQHHYSLSVNGGIPITKWWNSYTNLTGYHLHNKADYEEGKTIDLKATAFNIYSQHTFKLPADFSIEVSGWYNSPAVFEGIFEMQSMWSVDAGIQKKLFDGRGNLRVSVGDIFKTNAWSGSSNFGIQKMQANGGWDSRRFKVSFSYLFGNSNVKSRNRKTGMEQESKRVKSDG